MTQAPEQHQFSGVLAELDAALKDACDLNPAFLSPSQASATLRDLAFEVADLVEHASSRLGRLLDPDTVITGFELTPKQRGRVEADRIVLAAFWLVMLLPGNPGHAINPLGSVERQSEHLLELMSLGSGR